MTAKRSKSNGEPGGISRFLSIAGWLPNYDLAWLKGDLIAGLSVWALMVPTSMGYATISGVPVQYGLYAAALGLIAFALFTTSRQVTQGPSSSTAAVLGAAVLGVASAGSDEAIAMAAAIVLVSGLLYIIMYVLKMGWVSEFLSSSVLTGFTFGVAINVAAGELFKITGTEGSGGNTWQKLWTWLTSLPETNMPTLVVGIVALILVFGIKLLLPKVPGALVAVVLGIGATALLGLGDLGVELIAAVPRGLPGMVLPDLGFLLDIPLEVTVELGRSSMIINDMLQLTQGSVVELTKGAGEPVDIFVNHKLLGKGEVVVVNDRYGVRITEIISQAERVQNMG